VLGVGLIGLVALVVWSLRSLPPSARGRQLCTQGAFRYVRHPLYAAFLSHFNFALALFLGHPIYLLWAIALHPIWHVLMRSEERLMLRDFGEPYREYAARTGRFIPRFWS
jgi:protein-S-isoprenylcysteine O-methyltransferase Ste14